MPISSLVTAVGEENFETEVVKSKIPVIVDWYAAWCPPCQMLTPVLEQLAETYYGRVKFVKCDTDRYDEFSRGYGVQKVPNLTFFRNGEVVDQSVGYMSANELSQKIQMLFSV